MIISGKEIAAEIKEGLKREIAQIEGRKPSLVVIVVGNDEASHLYINRKARECEEVGIHSMKCLLPENISEEELLKKIKEYNTDPEIDGILVQLPLPSHINEAKVTRSVDPKKDVDGFHPENMGKLLVGDTTGFIPCTPLGVREILNRVKVDLYGKHVVILGRSTIVGKPMAAMLMQRDQNTDCTVTLANKHSNNLPAIIKQADILIVAIGVPKKITKDLIKKDAIVIDVGINRVNGKLVGDVDFENVKDHCSILTPVPGGVGPLTIAMLLKNTLKAYRR